MLEIINRGVPFEKDATNRNTSTNSRRNYGVMLEKTLDPIEETMGTKEMTE